jgi:hypothetical protein
MHERSSIRTGSTLTDTRIVGKHSKASISRQVAKRFNLSSPVPDRLSFLRYSVPTSYLVSKSYKATHTHWRWILRELATVPKFRDTKAKLHSWSARRSSLTDIHAPNTWTTNKKLRLDCPVHRYELLLLSCSLLSVDQLGFVVKALPIANTHARLHRLMPGETSSD